MYTYVLLYRCKNTVEYHNACVAEDLFKIQKYIILVGFQEDYDRLKLEVWRNGDFIREIEGNDISQFIKREMKR